jgi:beta-1,4-mannosyl-glycoprotein beta-1,4-N-acetylglucosaminyltransferase
MSTKIYDSFLFFNELELLELRLELLDPIVDHFLILESPLMFTGREKPLYFKDNIERFSKYLPKITHRVAEIPKITTLEQVEAGNTLMTEEIQRNLLHMMYYDIDQNDIIILSDADEIPHPEILKELKEEEIILDQPYAFAQDFYAYHVNCKRKPQPWCGSVMFSKSILAQNTPEQVRRRRWNYKRVTPGGWHFSYLGGVQRIQLKLSAGVDCDLVIPEHRTDEYLLECISKGLDIDGRPGEELHFVGLDNSYPQNINNWIKKYPEMFHE